jgi:diacylglycerol O-acyltransferase
MASQVRRDRISAVDTAWLRMDRPHNLMMICGVLVFDRRIGLARLRRVVEKRFLVFRRFRQRAVERAGYSVWETDARFDIAHHLLRVSLPGASGRRELQTLVSDLIATPLDASRPMWQFHLVDNYDGASALVARIHHCYADGMALVRVMLSMTDVSVDGLPAMPFDGAKRSETQQDDDAVGAASEPVAEVVKAAQDIALTLLQRGSGLLQDPAKTLSLVGQGGALALEALKLALMAQDSSTRLKGRPRKVKRVAWADPLPLDEVKVVGKALSASVNDVLLSCVAGALRSYLVDKRDPVDDVLIRALVPVNLRPPDKAYRLGNKFGLVFLDLPVGIENPIARLYAVRENMRALKGSYQPILAMGLLGAMGAGPRMLQETLLSLLARNATAVMTNVPGPQQPLFMAGGRIDSLMFWVPQSGDLGMGVSILSYNGAVQFGLVTDRGLCPDPERIIERFGNEFEKLVLTTLMSPWPRDGELDPDVAERAMAVA